MLSVTYKPFMMIVIILNVVMLSVSVLSVVAPFSVEHQSFSSFSLFALSFVGVSETVQLTE